MTIRFDYGRDGLDVEVPERNLRAVLGLSPAPPLADPAGAVREVLRSPTGAAPLREVARGRRDACIVVCDITRPVPNELLLTALLEELNAAGLPDEAVTVLVATGLHRPNEGAELAEMLGAGIARRVRVVNHAARERATHRDLGVVRGAPALVDETYCRADLKLTTGLIEPHLMAGFSGGRKLICPGLCAAETIQVLHGAAILDSPQAAAGIVEGNPVHALALEVARRAGCDFIVNVALDEQRRVTGVFAGEMEAAWEAGVAHVRATATATLPEPADVVLTSSAGYPLDQTFYQAIKGVVGAAPAVREGGTVVLFADMREGLGGLEFQSLLARYPRLPDLMAAMRAGPFLGIDQWQLQEMGKVAERAEVLCYTDGLSASDARRTYMEIAASPAEAVERALARHGRDASVVAIPRGPYVLPVVTGSGEMGK